MSKRIILCSDGTGNTTIRGRGTNVWKLYEAIDRHGHTEDDALPRQIAYYDDGIGTRGFLPRDALDQALGITFQIKVRTLYAALCRVYDPGDEIFLFGFSRGAYTVRALAGMISRCGVIETSHIKNDSSLRRLVGLAYRLYVPYLKSRKSPSRFAKADENIRDFRDKHSWKSSPDISFIGVWDTVGAIGGPDLGVLPGLTFPDTRLPSNVRRACHALAIDDERKTFHPILWEESSEEHRIKQVWFPGVHANVGGGYPNQGLSLVALDWMMTEAESAGLRFLKTPRSDYKEQRNALAKLYNSRAGLGALYRYEPRDISNLCKQSNAAAKIHISVFDRISLCAEEYAPGNLPRMFEIVTETDRPAREGKAILDEVARDSGSASGALIPQDVSKLVRARQWSYYGLIGLSALVLVGLNIVGPEWYWMTRLSASTVSSVLGPLAKTIEKGGYFIDVTVWLCILYGILTVVVQSARRSMNDTFSRFWRSRLRPWLREKPDYLLVKGYFFTNRSAISGTDPTRSSSRGTLSGGVSQVSIPLRHRFGAIERPWLALTEDPRRHVIVSEIVQLDLNGTLRAIDTRAGMANREILLFVPGAPHTFSEALKRASQLSFDLRFGGVAVVYSWPASSGVTGYFQDATTADWAARDLLAVLSMLKGLHAVERVHVVAHGIAARMLVSVAGKPGTTLHDDESKLVDQLALVVPDVDADIFKHISDNLRRIAKRVTVYVSSQDRAMTLAARVHAHPRAGQSIDKATPAHGVDTIDVTEAPDALLLGKNATARLLTDLYYVLSGVEVSNRPGLVPMTSGGVSYWRMGP